MSSPKIALSPAAPVVGIYPPTPIPYKGGAGAAQPPTEVKAERDDDTLSSAGSESSNIVTSLFPVSFRLN